jgi:hypothetical protein
VLLSARNVERLRRPAAELKVDGVQVEIATGLQQFSALGILFVSERQQFRIPLSFETDIDAKLGAGLSAR